MTNEKKIVIEDFFFSSERNREELQKDSQVARITSSRKYRNGHGNNYRNRIIIPCEEVVRGWGKIN